MSFRPAACLVAFAALLCLAPAASAGRAPSLFVSASGSDSSSCTRTRPCRSLDRAYHVARPGQVVQVAGGTYGEQLLTRDASKTSTRDVVFRPAPRARVRLDDVRFGRWAGDVGASHVTLSGMTLTDGVSLNRVSDVTLRSMRIEEGFVIRGSRGIRILGGSVGPCMNCHPDVQSEYGSNPVRVARDIVIDGVLFHDIRRSGPGIHVECLLVSDVDGFVLRNSRFRRCGVFDALIGGTVRPPARNLLIENNFFAESVDGGYYSLSVVDGINVRIRNNSAAQGMILGAEGNVLSNWLVAGNLGPFAGAACDDRIRYRANVWRGGRCGGTDRSVRRLGFRNPGRFDLHLRRDSPAVNHGYRSSFPRRDIDGQRRPRGGAPDAGADEVR